MFVKIDDFVSMWSRESELTERVLNVLTDQSLKQRVAADYRSLGELAWHLVESINYMASMGLSFKPPTEDKGTPAAAAAIAEEYRRIGRAMLQAVETQWTDASLAESIDMGGEMWMNGASLHFIIMHQAHHRGQMTVLMRQAGLRLPDVYGPTREDWIGKGQPPLK
jgi:uncharacterized damage-inducible protein DinB